MAPTVAEHRFRAMGTDVHVIVVDGTDAHLQQAERAVRNREARWSRFRPDSELSVVNASAGRPVIVSADTFDLVAWAIDAWAATAGAFDPTVLSCLVAAGYDRSFEQIAHGEGTSAPTPAPVPAPGPAGVALDRTSCAIRLPRGVGLDLGGIAKGAAADAVVAEVLAAGAEGCCVNIGGDLRVEGRPPSQQWVVDLDCPGAAGPDRPRVGLASGAVCTSTTRKRSWIHERLGPQHHLRQPSTGHPLDTGVSTVTVISARATQAEVLAKAALAAGADGARHLLRDQGATGLVVTDDGTVVELDGFDTFRLDRRTVAAGGGA